MDSDPYNEQRLRNEVIYLHSLWHQGPPPPLPPQPLQPHHSFQPLNPTLFKKPKRPSKRSRDRNKMLIKPPVQVSTTEWPCPPSPPSNSTGWPSFPTTQFPSDADLHFSSAKVQAWDVGNRMQLKVVQEVKKFFKTQKADSDDDDEEAMDDADSDDDSEDEEGDGDGDCSGFFSKLFQENEELREFYVKNHENGEFGCLVCGGVGFIRRFKDCVALVQHTVSISKTKKMKAHRAFGQVVCKVLGWNINKLPSIASSVSEKKNASFSKSEEVQREVQEKLTDEAHNVESHDKETGEKEFAAAEQLPDKSALAVAENIGGGNSIATKLKENARVIEKGSIEGTLDCLQAGPGDGSNIVGTDVDLSSVDGNSAVETKGKEASGDEKLPTTDISNVTQSLQSVSDVGRSINDLLKETPGGKQEYPESTSNLVGEPRKEDGSGKNK